MGNIHIADWYATFCYLAGVDPTDPNKEGLRVNGQRFQLPGVDSLNMWPLISGDVSTSPRQEIPLAVHHPLFLNSALIVGSYKLMLGTQLLSYWQGPSFPNGTDDEPYGEDSGPYLSCGNDTTLEGGCLFNIQEDPGETKDLAQEMPDLLASMKDRLEELSETILDQRAMVAASKQCEVHVPGDSSCAAPSAYMDMLKRNGGYVGPWVPSQSEHGSLVI